MPPATIAFASYDDEGHTVLAVQLRSEYKPAAVLSYSSSLQAVRSAHMRSDVSVIDTAM